MNIVKELAKRRETLLRGGKVQYRGRVFWANMTTKEVYAHSIDEDIAGSASGYKVADIDDEWNIVGIKELRLN